jgi:hypothetical protein
VKGKFYLKEDGYTCWFDIFCPPYIRIQATNNAPDTPSSNWAFSKKKKISNWGITDKAHGREERSRCGRCAGCTRTVLTLPHPRVQFFFPRERRTSSQVSAPTTARPHPRVAAAYAASTRRVPIRPSPHRPAAHPPPAHPSRTVTYIHRPERSRHRHTSSSHLDPAAHLETYASGSRLTSYGETDVAGAAPARIERRRDVIRRLWSPSFSGRH